MKVVLISGSYPPDVCGVADYTERLYESFKEADVDISVYTDKPWNLRKALAVDRELSSIKADIYHMQYPATGYGWKLGPQLLSLMRPMVMTIHECSQAHMLRQLSLLFFSIRAHKVIFTNDYERRYAQRFAPWIKGRSTVIPIGNNIPLAPAIGTPDSVVTCFTLIRPQKGIEQVLELARLFKASGSNIRVRIVGAVLSGSEKYYARTREEARDLPVDWCIGMEGARLATALAETRVAYLPFPDGASERRSSLIAMLANAAAVITTRGLHTPKDLEEAVLFADSPMAAKSLAEDIFNDDDRQHTLRQAALKYAVRYSWASIRSEHLSVYRQVVDQATLASGTQLVS
jgi:glycosyltransferase involved in cell wall biosynthesis